MGSQNVPLDGVNPFHGFYGVLQLLFVSVGNGPAVMQHHDAVFIYHHLVTGKGDDGGNTCSHNMYVGRCPVFTILDGVYNGQPGKYIAARAVDVQTIIFRGSLDTGNNIIRFHTIINRPD